LTQKDVPTDQQT